MHAGTRVHKTTSLTGLVPERVQLTVHTTEPTGTVPEPFHCDHIARWSARTGTSGRSGTGLNTGNWNRSGTVLVSNLWCEHGLRKMGDLNGQREGYEQVMGYHGIGSRNGEGERVLDFCNVNHMKIMNSFFQHIPAIHTPGMDRIMKSKNMTGKHRSIYF